jgi:SAM-dependent methyltransferase
MADARFDEYERAGWTERATAYDDAVSPLSSRAIGPLLEAVGPLQGAALLDLACGPGHLAAAAAARGARTEGLDFAPTMIERARARYPSLRWTVGDAHRLPYEDAAFDAVACAFGVLHMTDPDAALAQVRRVLRPGGRVAFTVWCAPQQGGELFGLVLSAIQRHGRLDVPLPPAPPIFRFADAQECERTLGAVGFADIACTTLPIDWIGEHGTTLVDDLYRSTVRTAMLLEAQTPEARAAIHRDIAQGAERTRGAHGLRLAMPAWRVTAVVA